MKDQMFFDSTYNFSLLSGKFLVSVPKDYRCAAASGIMG